MNKGNNHNSKEINKKINKDDISTPEQLIQLLISKNLEILNHFEIKKYIGSGSESIIFEVLNKKTQESYAMKIIIIKKGEKEILMNIIF